jgi:glycosyltransferase involved in cell wall biosynthesis
MPRVSVVIPTHNRAALLQGALASVRGQTYQDLEIIVADDASSDDTAQVVAGLDDGRLRYFRHVSARGEAAATNTGVGQAAGEYVAFLHDDDRWLPAKLERQLEIFAGSGAKVGAVYSGFISIGSSGKELRRTLPTRRGKLFGELCRQNCIGVPSTVMVRRECFARVGLFDENIAYGADYDMWIRIARYYDFDYAAEPLVLYSVHEQRLSANYAKILQGKEAQLRKYAGFFAADRKSYSHLLLSVGVLHCYNRNLREGRRAFLRAIKNAPFDSHAYLNLLLSLCGTQAFAKIKALAGRL